MDELIRWGFQTAGDELSMIGIYQVMTAMLLSFALSLVVGYMYRVTHVDVSYSQSTVKTFVLMSVIVSVIMIIIGSNIARAFSLVGALSIIRFRSAIKNSVDVAFIFMTMAIGMACGTGFYAVAILFTFTMSTMIYFLYRFDIGAHPLREMVLKIHAKEGTDPEKDFNDIFYKHLSNYALLSAETMQQGTLVELVFTVELRRKSTAQDLIHALNEQITDGKVQILTGLSNVNI